MSRLNQSSCFLMCAALACVSLSAHAQIKAKVVVVPFAAGDGASETASGKFNALFLEELKTRGDVLEVMPNPATKAATPPPAATPSAAGAKGPSAEATAAMESGKKAFDDLRFEDAVTNLRKGIDAMLADPATADYEGVTDAYVKLAAAAFRMGEEKDAKTALLDLARFAPSYVMPPGFPPVFQREFEKAKKRLDKQPKGTISIEGPPGSTAYVDGRDLGMVPVLEENVPAGAHYVKVEGSKNDRFGQVVQVNNGLVKVKASFGSSEGGGARSVIKQQAGVADPAIGANVDAETQNRLIAYAKAAGADYAFIGYVYKTSDSQLTAGTALFSLKKTQFATLTPVSFDTDVLTANTEAYKLADELSKKLMSLGTPAPLPINLAVKPKTAGTGGNTVAKTDKPTNDDLDTTGPKSGGKKVILLPNPDKKDPDVVVDPEVKDPDPGTKVADSKPVWPWILVGVALAAGAGVGIGVGVAEATRPVTGTVTATW